MPLTPGTRFGSYEIVSPLGAGGMGEVYRARDTRLKRDVALKILPPQVVADRERVARFQREAELLATLNHPNIALIYGVEDTGQAGALALVMELVDGEDLAQRIARGPMALDEASPIARQIVDALDAAHRQGIVHRDLKPANIKVRPDGVVKVLDFGLAKAMDGPVASSDASANSPTLTSPARTVHGMILGTAAYMSPEQAKGKPVDQRADVWSFGCVLFEMLTGRRAFGGDEVTEIISAVLRDAPDFSLLPGAVPLHVRATLQSCLEKDVRRRWHSMGDVQLLLDGQFDIGTGAEVARRSASAPRMRLMAVAVVVLTMTTALAVGALMFRRPAAVRPLTRLGLSLPEGATVRDLTITPDGSKVVYVGDRGRRVYVRSLDALEPVEIANGALLAQPSISPNGQWVSFVDESVRLRKVPISGGPSSAVANLDGAARGVTWLTDDTLIVGTAARTGLLRVSASGAQPPTAITTLDDSGVDHVWPERLPDGQALLFGMEGATSGDDNRQVAALDMSSGRLKIVVRGGGRPRFVAGGFLAYGTRGKTFAVPFRLDDLEVPEGATPLDLGFPAGAFAVSAEGTLVLANGNAADGADRVQTMVWVDRSGRETPIAAPARVYQYPQISPDGTRVAVSALGEMADLWIWTQASASQTRFTLEPSTETTPLWTPDGKRLVFASNRADGVFNIWWQAADGTGSAEQLTASPVAVFPTSVSPDGKQVVYWAATPTGRDLMMVALDGSRRVTALLQTPADELRGAVSPDGRWLAYESNLSGQPNVFVRPFPRMNEGQWQVSMAGGRQPLWSRDGKELFFFSMDGEFMRMPVSAGANGFIVGTSVRLFERRFYTAAEAGLVARTYDVSPDGQRFLLLKSASGSDTPPTTAPEVVLVQNWADDLKRVMDRK